MEREFEAIKDFLLTDFAEYLKNADSKDTPIPLLTDKTIIFGAVDITKYNAKMIVSVLPEEQTENDNSYISKKSYISRFTLTFVFQKSNYDVLIRQMARVSSALRQCLLENTFNDTSITVQSIGQRKYYVDAGTAERQATAFELELTIISE